MPLGIVNQEDYERDLNPTRPENIPAEKELPAIKNEDFVETPTDSDNSGESIKSVAAVEVLTPIGRGRGNTEVPASIRNIIGASSIEEGSGAAAAIGKFLGLSQSSVSAYAKGATSTATYNKPNTDLAQHLLETRQKIVKRAQGKLFKSLNVIDDKKLEALDAIQASQVARNMSAIVKNMEPDMKQGNTFNGPVITFYAPSIVNEDRFDSITISE